MACIDDIIEQASTILKESEIRALEKELKKRLAAYTGSNPGRFILSETEKIIGDIKQAAIIQKRNSAKNAIIKANLLEFFDNFDGDAADALEAVMVGIAGKKKGGRNSIDARQQAYESQLLSDMVAQLRKENLLELLNNRELDADIARELWAMIVDNPKSVTGNEDAFKIAQIFKRTQDASIYLQNDLGAWIRDLQGYIVRQGHDAVRIRRAGIKQYIRDLGDLIDFDRTLKGADPKEFFEAVFADFISGRHGIMAGVGDDFAAFRGVSNIAKKASEARVLHFKNADAWMAYNKKYGTGSLTESMFTGIRRAADNAGLMEVLGTNPRAMFNNIRDTLLDANKLNEKVSDRLRRKRFDWFMDELDGTINQPGSVKWAAFGAGARALINMARLGGTLITSFNDIVTKAASLKRQGTGFLDAYKQGFEDVLKGRRKGVQREIADLLGEGFDGMLGAVFSRFNPQDNMGGQLSKMTQLFFKLNGLNWWTDAHKTGAALMLSRNLANNVDRSWSQLPKGLRDSLALYFDEKTWDMIRGTELRNADGKLYMTPDMIRDIPDQALIDNFGAMSERELRIRRQQIETDFRAYMADSVDFAVLTPDAKIRAIAKGGSVGGSGTGEAMRFFMQFKSFPMTFVQRGLGQFFGDNKNFLKQLGNGTADRIGLVHLMLGATVMGYLSLATKDILKNRTPRDPSDPKVWLASFVQGGGLGIYGDLLFGTSTRYGQGALQTMLGPGFGSAAQVLDLWNIVRGFDAEGRKIASKIFNISKGFIPFQNLFYSKWATDYLIMDTINETLNPGYKERVIQRIRENGQEPIIGGN